MEKLLFVSCDSHAEMPPETWEDYLETQYHELLPQLERENERLLKVSEVIVDYSDDTLNILDGEGAIRSGGVFGVWDRDRRLGEMDREGVAAEVVFFGDFRAISLFHGGQNDPYPADVRAAGARAYSRWLADNLIDDNGRILPLANVGPCVDMDAEVRELEWLAEHKFLGTLVPGFTGDPSLPPLYDRYFEPFWAACEDLGLVLGIHAGYGGPQGKHGAMSERILAGNADSATVLQELFAPAKPDMRPRQALWQLMLGGVFDRHPGLKIMVTEVRADWLPATLARLDEVFERNETPTALRPSEYWERHAMAGVSFMRRPEVELRHEIGVQNIAFGRDYPHAEGTWPRTWDWLADILKGVPEDEVRLMLGENLIRFLNLDRRQLRAVANRIGPDIGRIVGSEAELDSATREVFDRRGGFLKPAELVDVNRIDDLIAADLASAK